MNPPVATSQETIDALLQRAKRKKDVPIRRAFVQGGERSSPRPGPLADFVRHHDGHGLELYLLILAVASAAPWNVDESATLWARVLDLGDPDGAASAVSKIWQRLDRRGLIARTRVKRRASITKLREDGSGGSYEHPGKVREIYFKLPLAYWTAPEAWYRKLHLPEMAMLLIALSLKDGFVLPYEKAKAWYGISADTAERGMQGLLKHGLLSVRKAAKKAPLAPEGYTVERHYTLQPPFGPHSVRGAVGSEPRREGYLVALPQ